MFPEFDHHQRHHVLHIYGLHDITDQTRLTEFERIENFSDLACCIDKAMDNWLMQTENVPREPIFDDE